jgi:protein TonB
MTAFALHLPEQRSPGRWLSAAAVILAVHAGILVALVWHRRTPPPPELAPAIAVSLAPVQGAAPQVHDEDLPAGPEMQQADAVPPEPPKPEEQKVEQQAPPPPPASHAEAVLPKDEPKPVERPKQELQPPTTAPPKNDRVGQFTPAASNAYDALVVGHLARFKRYPSGAHGKVTVRFVLDRAGKVVERAVVVSSGNAVIDREALETLRRASPFPAFPPAKPGNDAIYTMPITYAPR